MPGELNLLFELNVCLLAGMARVPCCTSSAAAVAVWRWPVLAAEHKFKTSIIQILVD